MMRSRKPLVVGGIMLMVAIAVMAVIRSSAGRYDEATIEFIGTRTVRFIFSPTFNLPPAKRDAILNPSIDKMSLRGKEISKMLESMLKAETSYEWPLTPEEIRTKPISSFSHEEWNCWIAFHLFGGSAQVGLFLEEDREVGAVPLPAVLRTALQDRSEYRNAHDPVDPRRSREELLKSAAILQSELDGLTRTTEDIECVMSDSDGIGIYYLTWRGLCDGM